MCWYFVCIHVYVNRSQERALDSLGLEPQMTVSCRVVITIKPRVLWKSSQLTGVMFCTWILDHNLPGMETKQLAFSLLSSKVHTLPVLPSRISLGQKVRRWRSAPLWEMLFWPFSSFQLWLYQERTIRLLHIPDGPSTQLCSHFSTSRASFH